MLRRISLSLALSLAPATVPGLDVAFAAGPVSQEQLKREVSEAYHWDSIFEKTVDGFIEEGRNAGFWTNGGSTLTEPQLIARVRDLLFENKREIVMRAETNAVSRIDAVRLATHLGRLDRYEYRDKDFEVRQQVIKSYYDAIFDAMKVYTEQAKREIGSW
ncbi:hypothetical protein [Consotaella aegiceratis]|uniref:hypothetical protein n=1 Tax=Consotaella aegiceratis TaxID=3097961 RepID=UPI002F428F1D